jgi:hypothetical protein
MSHYDSRVPPNIQIQTAILERNPTYGSLDVHLRTQVTRDTVSMMLPLEVPVIRTYPLGDMTDPRPAFRLDQVSAQAMLDGMWKAGIRPSSGDRPADQEALVVSMNKRIEDLKEHIEDLRMALNLQRTTGSF